MSRPKNVRIRRRRLPQGIRFEVDFGIVAGKRFQKFFKTRPEAERFRDENKDLLKSSGEQALALSQEDRILFQAARDRLATVGAGINQAVDFYLAHHRPLKESISLGKLLEWATLQMELEGLRPQYLSQFGCSCRSFIRGREGVQPNDVTKEMVKEWILGNDFAPKTQRVYLGDLRTLFSRAVEERYMRKNPIAGEEGFIPLAAVADVEITSLDVEECGALLRTALFGKYEMVDRSDRKRKQVSFRELIGYVAVAMFPGVRPKEIARTPLSRIDLRGGTVVVTGGSAKTRKRRVVELPRVALIWLRLWQRLCPGAPLVPKNFVKKWRALRKAAGITAWPHDVLRHTAASYHYAVHQNRALLQAMLGHTEDEDTLDRHYRAVQTLSGKTISKKMGEEFYRLTPRRVRLDYSG